VTAIENSWEEKIQCELDFPCCEYSVAFMTNLKQSWKADRLRLISVYGQWSDIEGHRLATIATCPEGDFAACADLPACWNAGARADDYPACTCPDFVLPSCPVTECWDGSSPDIQDCACPEEPVAVPEPEIIEPEIVEPEIVDICDRLVDTSFADSAVGEFPGLYQAPSGVPSYDSPLIGIQQYGGHRFDFLFGCGRSSDVL